ncbi:MauE/DoxX family redox-associated membrane protein [Thermoactinospora rubra]|uniref:MauE/DoxX family redox-associated membrane protein n=1 Tax=Thermoactinospora rubra TaxID=1088767 RepID=UPI000A10C0DC|nr:MauE/DoxX family redox-associated membrane protein [Thermoactinospora rubra]
MQGIAASQPYVIAAFLIWAALMKLLSRRMRSQAGQTALARLAGPARAVPLLRLVAAAELAVSGLLLAPPSSPWDAAAAAALSAGFLAYLTYAAIAAPEASCGCLGAHGRRVDRRSFARAGLLLAMSVLAAAAGPYPISPESAVLAAVEAAALIALSPELDRHWLTPLRRLVVRLRNPLAVRDPGLIPLETSLQLLYRSPAYCSASAHLSSDVQDFWDDGGLRFASFAARGRTAVFSIPLYGGGPADVRVALVDEPVPR